MKKHFIVFWVAVAAAASFAVPTVSNVQVTQHPATHAVTVDYDLTEDAIVTVAFLTNGVVCEAATSVAGDVWRLVKVTGELKKGSTTEYMSYPNRKISWDMAADLGADNVANHSVTARVSAWTTDAPPPYYVFDLVSAHAETRRRHYECEWQLPGGIGSDLYRTTKMVFRRIPAANQTFVMGAPATETEAAGLLNANGCGQETQHNVTFTRDFYIGVFEVTQAQWIQVMGSIPGESDTSGNLWSMRQHATNDAKTLPIQSCARNRWLCGEKHAQDSWKGDVDELPGVGHPTFFYKFRQLAGDATATTKHYNLPYEAQWEFACRAGTTTAFSDGRDYSASTDYSDIAVYDRQQAEGPVRVGSKKPNPWGLYDMHGNMGEVVLDNVKANATGSYVDANYAADATDPHGWEDTHFNVGVRGGSWVQGRQTLRSAYRNNGNWWGNPQFNQGFRIAVPVDEL